MKCQIQWIDEDGRRTPDDNEAVAMAHVHRSIWAFPNGDPANHIVGYAEDIANSYPICAEHLKRLKSPWGTPIRGWSSTPIGGEMGGYYVTCAASDWRSVVYPTAEAAQAWIDGYGVSQSYKDANYRVIPVAEYWRKRGN